MGGTGGLRMRESGLVREAGGDSSPTVSLTRDTARTGPVRPQSEGRGGTVRKLHGGNILTSVGSFTLKLLVKPGND